VSPTEIELVGAVVDVLRPLVEELVRDELGRALALRPASGGEWLTVEEYAALQRTTVAAVHQRLRRGQVPGASKDGRRWLIPAPSPRLLSTAEGPARAA
jgi:hypothetical protein